MIWTIIIWKIINKHKLLLDDNDRIFIKKLYEDYMDDFKMSSINKKKYLLFMAFYAFKKRINWGAHLYQQEHILLQVLGNMNRMYEKIRNQNESNLSHEDRTKLYNNFNKIFYKKHEDTIMPNKRRPERIADNSLNYESNEIMFTKFPEYHQISKNAIPKKQVQFVSKQNNNTPINNYRNQQNNDEQPKKNMISYYKQDNYYDDSDNDNYDDYSKYNNNNTKNNNNNNYNYNNNNNNNNKNSYKKSYKNTNKEEYDDDNDDYCSIDTVDDDKQLIGKTVTPDDIQNAKEEKMRMKIDAFKQLVVKKGSTPSFTHDQVSNSIEMKNIDIVKKRKNDM
jgi:hypothetical protein